MVVVRHSRQNTQGQQKATTKSLILPWSKESWDAITPDIIRRSFKKCGITWMDQRTTLYMFGQISDSKNEQPTSADFIGFDPEDLEESER